MGNVTGWNLYIRDTGNVTGWNLYIRDTGNVTGWNLYKGYGQCDWVEPL